MYRNARPAGRMRYGARQPLDRNWSGSQLCSSSPMRGHYENIVAVTTMYHAKHAVPEFGNRLVRAAQGRIGRVLRNLIWRRESSLDVGMQDTASLHLVGRVLAELYRCRPSATPHSQIQKRIGKIP